MAAKNEALRGEIVSLKAKVEALNYENMLLKNRETERIAKAIAQQPEATPAQPVEPLEPLEPGSAILGPPKQAGGAWFVNLASHSSRATANDHAAALREVLQPLNISVASAKVNGKNYFRVKAAGFV